MEVAIVGAGIAGASVAYHLSRQGWTGRITVFDRSPVADETTAKSAAFFGFYGTPTERRMKQYGMARYNQFLSEPRTEPAYEQIGRLDVATTEEGAAIIRTSREESRDERTPPSNERAPGTEADGADVDAVSVLDGETLREHVCAPHLDTTQVRVARYRPNVGYFTPRELALEFVERASERGVTFRTETAVEALLRDGTRVGGVRVDGVDHEMDAVVCAAGPWNPLLTETAGIDIPVRYTLAPILKVNPGQMSRTLPIVAHEESGVYVRGHHDGTVLVGYHPGGYDVATDRDPDTFPTSVPEDVKATMLETSAKLVPALADADVVDEWVGVRSRTPDGQPLVGQTALSGLWVVTFHSSGIQLAPAAGRVVARQLRDETGPAYADALSPNRFDQ